MANEVRTPEVVGSYSAERLFSKLGRFARVAGRFVVERALRLYYAAQHPGTPEWAKRVIYAALAYFVIPVDIIPDFVPAIGYTDDLGTMLVALLIVSVYVTPDVKAKARAKVRDWFGP